jgi:hypothetical protein
MYGPPSRPSGSTHVSTCAALTAGLMSGKVFSALQLPRYCHKATCLPEPLIEENRVGCICSNGLRCHRWHDMQRHQALVRTRSALNPVGRNNSLAGSSSKRKQGMSGSLKIAEVGLPWMIPWCCSSLPIIANPR